MSMPTLFVFARITPKPEHLDDARDAISGILEATLAEDGCRKFVLHEGHGDGCLYLYEEWDDEDALAAHYDQPYTKAVFEKYQSWLAEPVDVRRMARIS